MFGLELPDTGRVRRLVELHGGSVRALSDGRNGSEFVVDLPLGTRPDATEAVDRLETPTRQLPKRILIYR
jgi:two-component system CheB/CheR fusion protein